MGAAVTAGVNARLLVNGCPRGVSLRAVLALFERRQSGEHTSELAAEVGLTTTHLLRRWRAAGLTARHAPRRRVVECPRDRILNLRVSTEEKAIVVEAARADGYEDPSAWMREVMMVRAARVLARRRLPAFLPPDRS